MRALFEFLLCMALCLFTGIVLFGWQMTPGVLALYALIALAYAALMEGVVYGKVLR